MISLLVIFLQNLLAKPERGGGYGLEIPCVYRLYGRPRYIQRSKDTLEPLIAAGHL